MAVSRENGVVFHFSDMGHILKVMDVLLVIIT
jgi:hypothetical protein